ncbi:MAG TPA: hypothetical protein VJX69_13400 [Terriglobales bacterium]|nr:hypothetical protein [Terriglobales bacterium]
MANYDIADNWESMNLVQRTHAIKTTSIGQLEKWASDPDCNQRLFCRAALAKHEIHSGPVTSQAPLPQNEQGGVPFNPRTELSEDAKYIARTGMQRLGVELEAVSIWELTRFAWKWWWAVLLASIPIVGIALLIALIIAGLNRP